MMTEENEMIRKTVESCCLAQPWLREHYEATLALLFDGAGMRRWVETDEGMTFDDGHTVNPTARRCSCSSVTPWHWCLHKDASYFILMGRARLGVARSREVGGAIAH